MSLKRASQHSQHLSSDSHIATKKLKSAVDTNTYFYKTLNDSGLILKYPPDKCAASQKSIVIARNIKKNLQKHFEYPSNLSEFYSNFVKECHDLDKFKQFLFPNIVKVSDESTTEHPVSDSVIKLLLGIPIIQNKMIDYIFERAIDLAAQSSCGPWIQTILKCFSNLDNIIDSEKLFTNLINLLDITSEKIVRHEIITAIPNIIGDQEHHIIAAEMCRVLVEYHELIPAVLDCLSYLCLSEEQYQQLQKKTLDILMTLSKYSTFPLFVKFLLIPNQTETSYLEVVQGLRNALGWPATGNNLQDIASSQVLTATAIRNTMISSKLIANAWLKVISNCKLNTDHKPIDFIILLILYSTTEEKQNQVENIIRKQVKMEILRECLLDEAFEKFKPLLKDYLKNLIELTNSLLKTKADPEVESFASHLYTLMFSELEDCCQTIVAELLQLSLDSRQCVKNALMILNNVATKDMSLLKPQSIQMLTLLDRTNDMPLSEVRSVMNLLCGLAYGHENSVIRDDLHMIMRKELSSSDLKIKVQGILAGIHAIKYLMANTDDDDKTREIPNDVSFGSVTYFTEGDLREAAQIIELIRRSTKQFSDMVAFFYDELSKIISSATHINKSFMSWLTDAVTNDLQQNFLVDTIEKDKIGDLELRMQYSLNADSEVDEIIAINIAGLTLQPKSETFVAILSPLFQLLQILHSKQQDNNLSNIDALLGCAIVMPKFDVDLVEDMDQDNVNNILDCLVHCVNWFRELLNAFSTQDDDSLRSKILRRVIQIDETELVIIEILRRSKIPYKPPVTAFDINKYTGEQIKNKAHKVSIAQQKHTKNVPDDTVLPETARTQATQSNVAKNKQDVVFKINYRQLNLSLLHLFRFNMTLENESETELTPKILKFILKCVNDNFENILISKIKRKTFLSKSEDDAYDPIKAEKTAKAVSEILPNLMNHLLHVTNHIEHYINPNTQNDSETIHTAETVEYITCLENIYNMLTFYFKWIGFRNDHNALLKVSLRTVANSDIAIVSLKDLLSAVAKRFEKHEKFCIQLSTAVSLIELVKAIQNHSDNKIVSKISIKMAQKFMSQQWKTLDGLPEKGGHINQSVDRLASIYFVNSEILTLKNLSLQLTSDINNLKSRNDTLSSMKCINKNNFPILYRNLGTALYEATKSSLNKGLTNSQHLELWKDVATTLKYMSDIAKTLENRNNLSAFFKKSLPVLKLFMSQGMPILEIQFKNDTQEVLEILKILQQSTRFLQNLCCHSRLKKDSALLSKVPFLRQLLETILYKVKAVLAANKCSEAFWMGNLKNKNIHGEIIATQQSIASEESLEDCDEQLPEDDDTDESDEAILDPDSISVSDIV